MPHFWRCSVCQRDIPTGTVCMCASVDFSQRYRDFWVQAAAQWNDDQQFADTLPLHRAAFDLGYTERDRIFLKQLRIQP